MILDISIFRKYLINMTHFLVFLKIESDKNRNNEPISWHLEGYLHIVQLKDLAYIHAFGINILRRQRKKVNLQRVVTISC